MITELNDKNVPPGSMWAVVGLTYLNGIDVWRRPSRVRGLSYDLGHRNETVGSLQVGDIIIVNGVVRTTEEEMYAGFPPTDWVEILLPYRGYMNRTLFCKDSTYVKRIS